MSLQVWVPGVPAPQGSKTATVRNGRAVMWEASSKVKPWRSAVALACAAQAATHYWYLTNEPVHVHMVFHMPKPKSAKRDTPHVKPDLDKLVRSTLDGVVACGAVILDDALVISLTASKVYATPGNEGAQITVERAA